MLCTIPRQYLSRSVISADWELKLDDRVACADDIHESMTDIGEGCGTIEKIVDGLKECSVGRFIWLGYLGVLEAQKGADREGCVRMGAQLRGEDGGRANDTLQGESTNDRHSVHVCNQDEY